MKAFPKIKVVGNLNTRLEKRREGRIGRIRQGRDGVNLLEKNKRLEEFLGFDEGINEGRNGDFTSNFFRDCRW